MIRGVIQYRGSPEATKKELRAAVKPELARVVQWWHSKILPGHFLIAAEGKYRYRRRSASYLRQKVKRFGHRRPLEYTGDMKRQVTSMARITSTSKGAKVNMTGPRYLYMYRKDLKQPDKAAELTAITASEVDKLAQILDRRLTRRLNSVDKTETRRMK